MRAVLCFLSDHTGLITGLSRDCTLLFPKIYSAFLLGNSGNWLLPCSLFEVPGRDLIWEVPSGAKGPAEAEKKQ